MLSLSSKQLQRIETNGRKHFVLEVQTVDLDDLYFEDPNTLSESAKLFTTGVLLIEIAQHI